MISAEDRKLLDAFARRVRLVAPSAAIWAFGSRARGAAHPESDLDLCVVVPEATRDLRESVHRAAWEIGFEHGRLLAPVILTAETSSRVRRPRARSWRISGATESPRDRRGEDPGADPVPFGAGG